jgi:hypothetical protein
MGATKLAKAEYRLTSDEWRSPEVMEFTTTNEYAEQ